MTLNYLILRQTATNLLLNYTIKQKHMKKQIIIVALICLAAAFFTNCSNFEAGRKALEAGELDKALNYFDKEIEENPTAILSHYYRARVYFEKLDYVNALRDVNVVIANGMKNENAEMAKSYGLRAQIYLEINDTVQAIADYNTAIEINPLDADFYIARAQLYFAKKQYDKSEADYMRILKFDNENIQAHVGLARNYYVTHQYKLAIDAFTKVLALAKKSHPDVRSQLAYCYYQTGQYELAIAVYNKILTADTIQAYDYGLRADAKRLLGDYEGAVKDYSKAIALEPNESWFYYRRGWVNDEFRHNYSAGMNDYNKAIEIDPNYAYTYIHRAKLYKHRLNEPLKAIADFEKVLKLDTTITDEGGCRHYALLELDRKSEAIEWLNKTLEKYPSNGNYYDAACIYAMLKKDAEAVKYITLAFENGYRDIVHISKDDDLDNVRKNSEFVAVLTKWTKIIETENKQEIKKFNSKKNAIFTSES